MVLALTKIYSDKKTKREGVKNIQRGRTMCSIFRGYRQFQKFMGVGLKFGFKFELMIPEIGSHALAEGSRLTVPAPRRVQIFCRSVGDPPPKKIVGLKLYWIVVSFFW